MHEEHRNVLKSNFALLDGFQSDQQKGEPNPPLQVPPAEGATLLDLPAVDGSLDLPCRDVFDVLAGRRSRRTFGEEPVTQAELAFLLWATAGVQRVVGKGYVTMRTVPSAGARHPFETYLTVSNVEGLQPGSYHYLPLSHQLELLRPDPDGALPGLAARASLNQGWVADAAVVFVWTALPYRCEWRYGPASPKPMLLDAGHIGQNLYLACEATGLGTCAIAAYDQQAWDELLRLDGKDHFTVYLSPVGRQKG